MQKSVTKVLLEVVGGRLTFEKVDQLQRERGFGLGLKRVNCVLIYLPFFIIFSQYFFNIL